MTPEALAAMLSTEWRKANLVNSNERKAVVSSLFTAAVVHFSEDPNFDASGFANAVFA